MIAELKSNNNGTYYCSNCRMISKPISPTCSFCEAIFSNYEEVQLEIWKELFNNTVQETNTK